MGFSRGTRGTDAKMGHRAHRRFTGFAMGEGRSGECERDARSDEESKRDSEPAGEHAEEEQRIERTCRTSSAPPMAKETKISCKDHGLDEQVNTSCNEHGINVRPKTPQKFANRLRST